METYVRKNQTVQARENKQAGLTLMSARKGQQRAGLGDFLVQDDAALAVLRRREKAEKLTEGAIPNKGTVYMVPRVEFLADYELASEPVVQSHQERVVTEKAQLDEKITKLASFATGSIFATLSVDERDRLNRQLTIMSNYSEVLGQRIAAFS